MRDSGQIIDNILDGDILELGGIEKINCVGMMIYWVIILDQREDTGICSSIFCCLLWWVSSSNAVDQILVDNLLLAANGVDKVPDAWVVAIEGSMNSTMAFVIFVAEMLTPPKFDIPVDV